MKRHGEWALHVARGKELYRLAFQGEKGTHRGIVADFAFAAFRGFLGIRYVSVYALSAAALNFIAALMSLSGLQNSLISEFSPGDEAYRVLMNTLTGTGVWFLAVGISVFIMISSSVRKRKGETS